MERPMATLGFTFFLSLILASFLALKMTVVLAALAFLAFLAALLLRSLRQNRQVMTVLLAAMAAFCMYTGQEWLAYRPLQPFDGQTATLRMQTLDFVEETGTGSLRVTARVLEGGLPQNTRLSLYLSGMDLYPSPYDILEGRFTLTTPSDSRDGQLRGYSKSQKIYLNAWSADYGEQGVTLTAPDTRPWMFAILRLRRAVRMAVAGQPHMSDVSGLMAGIAFGFRDDIPADVIGDFRTIGVTHLLAVSGLQTALIAQALLWLLLRLRVSRRLSALLAIIGVVFFMALTGFSSSVTRAGLTSIVYLAGLCLRREADGLNSLGFAVFALCAVNPYAVNDVGLLLSVAATAGLLVFARPLQRATSDRLRKRGGLWVWAARPVDAVAVTVAATVFTLPVILWTFGQIALISPIANWLMVFPATAVTVMTAVAAFLALSPLHLLAAPFFWVGKWVTRYLVWVAHGLASVPMASVWSRQVYLLVAVPAGIGLMLLGYHWLGRRGLRVMALWSVIALLCGTLSYSVLMRGVTTISVLSAGNGTAVVLSRGDHRGVILMGDNKAVKSAVRELDSLNIRRLDFVLIPSADDESASSAMLLTENRQIDCLITGSAGRYSHTVNSLTAGEWLPWEDSGGDTVDFWDDCRAERSGNWVFITIGQTRLLLCPEDGDAADLTASRRQTHLAVFTAVPPAHVSSLSARAAVLSCTADSLTSALKALPQTNYLVSETTHQDVTYLTRGQGDLTAD